MDIDKLFKLGPPSFFITSIDEQEFGNLYLRLALDHKGAAIRRIRGGKSRIVDDFFNEASAALQFPYYFGENWPAFEECLTDLEWLRADAYILMIDDAHLLLSEDADEDFRVLVEILDITNKRWLTPNQYVQRNRIATPFHVLFRCAASNLATFSNRLAEVNAIAESL